MKLIVNISPEDYDYLKSYREFYNTSEGRILKAIANGKDATVVIAEVTATVLTELQLEIEEQRQDNPEFNIWKDGYNTANDIDCVIIQQKINSLKEDSP